MADKSAGELRSAVAALAQRRSILLSVVAAALFAVSTLLVALASPLSDELDTRQLVVGLLLYVLAAAVGVLREWSQWWIDRGQVAAAAQFRIAVKDALWPVAAMIAELPALTPSERKRRLPVIATQVTGSMGLLLTEVDGLRATVYQLDGTDRMTPIGFLGRGDKPGDFVRRPAGTADEAFDAVELNQPTIVHDINVKQAPRNQSRPKEHTYRTFITVPIVVGDRGYGMLALDAPKPRSFTDTDVKLCEFVAELLGVAFACANC